MKHFLLSNKLLVFFFLLFTISISACKKKTTEADSCKTCRAYGIDGLIKEQEVCSEEAETSFRKVYAGKEINCQ